MNEDRPLKDNYDDVLRFLQCRIGSAKYLDYLVNLSDT